MMGRLCLLVRWVDSLVEEKEEVEQCMVVGQG